MQAAKKILVVEDEADVRAGLVAWLEDEMFEVAEAGNGNDGLAEFKRFHPDLALLDMHMPDMSGPDLCRAIREISDIPLIMITRSADVQAVRAAIDAGASDFVLKRGGFDVLVDRIIDQLHVERVSISEADLDEALPAQALSVTDVQPTGTEQTFSVSSGGNTRSTVGPALTDLWAWNGEYFGVRDGDDLWTHEGRHVGKFGRDHDIFQADGGYLGSLLEGRLIAEWQKTASLGSTFTALPAREAHRRLADRDSFEWLAGFKDFPSPDSL